MVHFQTEQTCSIPWCWRAGDQPAGGQTPHHFCRHHWGLVLPASRQRFLTLVARRRWIDRIWTHGAFYDEIVKRGHFLKLCHVSLWAKELEDAAAERLKVEIVKADRSGG